MAGANLGMCAVDIAGMSCRASIDVVYISEILYEIDYVDDG